MEQGLTRLTPQTDEACRASSRRPPPPGGGRSVCASKPGGGGSGAAYSTAPRMLRGCHPTPDRTRRQVAFLCPPPPGEGWTKASLTNDGVRHIRSRGNVHSPKHHNTGA